jgi:hypothetical protein
MAKLGVAASRARVTRKAKRAPAESCATATGAVRSCLIKSVDSVI